MPIQLSDLGSSVLDTQYAVRGPIVARAQELERAGRSITYCNIGNPQALGQRPLTWTRRVLALCEQPDLAVEAPSLFPSDAVEAATRFLAGSAHGLGAYSESKGLRVVREAVASFIKARDGIEADPESIYLTDGASKGVQAALNLLIAGPEDGILVPTPQYPLYSATITMLRGRRVPYFLDEERGWSLSKDMLDEALAGALRQGTRLKAIVVINPGNPTGAVLDADNVRMIVGFAREHGLAILADEVYQDNVYKPGARFHSFAGALDSMREKDVSLFSFHSTSKGFLGECGQRGGYMELRNVPPEVAAQVLKLQSVALCSNLGGQATLYTLVAPPGPSSPSRAEYERERSAILGGLAEKADLVARGLNGIPGFRCNDVAGAMYAFPRITAGVDDEAWCMALLEKTGICVVPGTGFGQLPGTSHFRMTILPPKDRLAEVVEAIASFASSYS